MTSSWHHNDIAMQKQRKVKNDKNDGPSINSADVLGNMVKQHNSDVCNEKWIKTSLKFCVDFISNLRVIRRHKYNMENACEGILEAFNFDYEAFNSDLKAFNSNLGAINSNLEAYNSPQAKRK